MELLVTKFSNGKYQNDDELFAEPISDDNVKLMGEIIALQTFRTEMRFNIKYVARLYYGFLKDMRYMNDPDYCISDGYDYAQMAICFLAQFKGRYVSEICGDTIHLKNVTIKHACYRQLGNALTQYRRKTSKLRALDFTDLKHMPADPVNYYEKKEPNFEKADAIIEAMQLSELELAVLNCYMNGMVQSEVMAELGIGRGTLNHRKACIRKRYIRCFGEY